MIGAKRGLGLVVAALVSLGSSISVFATTYMPSKDFAVRCVDVKTGAKRWQTKPKELLEPRLRLIDGLLVADDRWADEVIVRQLVVFDFATGAIVERKPASNATVTAEGLHEPRNMVASSGQVFATTNELEPYDGLADGLYLATKPKPTLAVPMESLVLDVSISGSLAIFTMSGGHGEVYAYDLDQKRLAWEFAAAKTVPRIDREEGASFTVDGDKVFVAVDQHVFALDVATGALKWHRALPKQRMRPFDHPGGRFARVGDQLFVGVYDKLFVFDALTGTMRWHVAGGAHSYPWPLVYKDTACFAVRGDDETEMVSTTLRSKEAPSPSALKITRSKTRTGDTFTIKAILRSEIPNNATVWWSLQPPPTPTQPSLVLTLGHRRDSPTVKLTVPLKKPGTAYFKFNDFFNQATITLDGKPITTQTW
jgi:hypothetical protein